MYIIVTRVCTCVCTQVAHKLESTFEYCNLCVYHTTHTHNSVCTNRTGAHTYIHTVSSLIVSKFKLCVQLYTF